MGSKCDHNEKYTISVNFHYGDMGYHYCIYDKQGRVVARNEGVYFHKENAEIAAKKIVDSLMKKVES